ncbi:MAG TPA: hypothetical protein VJT72_21050 [Pseudonocardiaceae bacterium]|nr:hypothetical protein [Pseudonocardiaceae bacterium]
MPITEPAPELLAHPLLTEHGFQLFSEADNSQRTRSMHRFGYVSHDAELILLAEVIRDETIGYPEHPLTLAEHWTAAGFSAKIALNWLRSGILSPEAAHASITAETPRPILADTNTSKTAPHRCSDTMNR